MASIKRYPWISHFLGSPTGYVVHLQKGSVRHQGVGQAFWFRPANSVLSEVPVDDQELPTLFHAITRDHQDVSVQANVTYRFIDPVSVSSRLDFGLQPAGDAPATGKEQVATIIGQLCQSHAIDHIATTTLAEALERGVSQLRNVLAEALRADTRLLSTGIEILGVQVLAVRPESDVERALQTPVREQLQAEADRAVYERRAVAVERERTISENEMASQIELATRREHLVGQEGANARRAAEEKAAAGLIDAHASAQRQGISADAEANQIRLVGEAAAAREAATMDVYRDVDQATLLALALRDAAASLPNIGNLTITPDLLSGALAGLLREPAGGAVPAGAAAVTAGTAGRVGK
ncbi:regulator of protease activity HflC (stomatin/prohibitin superfamily) [Arthrobacter ginsengisoli]|uniref:Regulator of protease activity HflC (Stomatin/prohibitin superfamily) n=1 Tax=Arthrobacter ginsengisoli TaxID=1356565 RepID=A0ABU1U782_9MICC|nr:SPFH domain-containing protein [Arthrobacter ginsengisoli]MDR7081048.1 regulator of protease activity HflC (stomatin/prohibitin superfamily) [Arthrobacter ginsengisoli]